MEKIIQEFRIIETDDGFRIEIKGDKEYLRQFVMNRGFRLGLSASQATGRLRQCSGEECQSGRPPGWTEEKAQQRFGTDILAYKYTSDGYLLIGCADDSVRALRSEE